MRKRISVFIVFVLITLIGLTACSNTNNGTVEETDSNSSEKVKLRITWWGSQSRHDYTQKLLDLYTEQNPHVTFEATPSGWDGYFDKLSAQAAGNTMPDIIQMDYGYISTFASNELLADLQSFVDKGTLNMSNVDSNLVDSGKVNGQLTGAPLSSAAIAVTYNPEVFEKAGLDMPTTDWTWEDFKSNMLDIQAKTGLYGTAKLGDMHNFSYWVRQHGASLFAEDGTKLGYEDDRILVDFLNLQKELQEKDAMPNPDEWAQIASQGKEAEPVVLNEGGTTYDWSNFAVIASGANPNLKVMTPPKLPDGENGLWIKPGMFFSVAKSSKHQEEAAKFIDWFINSKEANDIILAERGIPVSSQVREEMKAQLTPQQQEMFDYIDLATEHSSKIDPPEPAGVAEVTQLLTDTTNQVMYGQTEVEEAAEKFRTEANKVLSKNK